MQQLKWFLWIFLLIPTLSGKTLQAQDASWEMIYNQIQLRIASQAENLSRMAYTVDSTTRITDGHKKVQRAVSSKRLVNLNWPNDSTYTFLKMQVNGRELSADEIRAEMMHRSKPEVMRSPFHPWVSNQYEFELKGATLYQDLNVWEITYKPKTPGKDFSKGKIFVDQTTYDIVYMAFSPSLLPGMVKSMDATITYQYIDGLWVPETMIVQGHIKVAFIFTFSQQYMEIKETFSNYLF